MELEKVFNAACRDGRRELAQKLEAALVKEFGDFARGGVFIGPASDPIDYVMTKFHAAILEEGVFACDDPFCEKDDTGKKVDHE